MPTLDDIRDEYDFLDADDRYRLLIDLGKQLEPMPDALKTDATLVRGCSAAVWVYPTAGHDGSLHFLADSNAAITKGIIALVLSAVQDRAAPEIAATDIAAALAPFDLGTQPPPTPPPASPNMSALTPDPAGRLVSPAGPHWGAVAEPGALRRPRSVSTLNFAQACEAPAQTTTPPRRPQRSNASPPLSAGATRAVRRPPARPRTRPVPPGTSPPRRHRPDARRGGSPWRACATPP